MNKNIIRKLHKNIDATVWDIFKKNNVMLAGGTFERLFNNQPINDLDIYFRKPMDAYNTIMELLVEKYSVLSKSNRSLLLKKNKLDKVLPINVIIMKYFNNLGEVMNLFDYECCKAGFDFSNDSFEYSLDFWESLQTKNLTYTGSLYPIGALMRLNKYISRGYTADYVSVLKLYRDLRNVDTTDPSVLEQQIGGMYGCAIDLKGLTLDQIIDKIENTISYEKQPKFIDSNEIEDIFADLFTTKKCTLPVSKYSGRDTIYQLTYCGDTITDIREYMYDNTAHRNVEEATFPMVFGKWINTRDNKYYSNYDPKFEYKLGEVAIAKHSGGLYIALESRKHQATYAGGNNVWAKISVESIEDVLDWNNSDMIRIKKGKVIEISENRV